MYFFLSSRSTNIQGVIPLVLTITWSRQTKLAAFVSPVLGMVFSLVIWITTAYHYFGYVTITSLGEQLPCMFGAICALFLPGVLSVIISLTISPYKFDWKILSDANLLVKDDSNAKNEEKETTKIEMDGHEEPFESKLLEKNQVESTSYRNVDNEVLNESIEPTEQHSRLLSSYRKYAYVSFFSVLLITWVIWPLPLYRDYIWSAAYFKGYVAVSFIWLYSALLLIGIYPLIAGRHSILKVIRGLHNDILKRK